MALESKSQKNSNENGYGCEIGGEPGVNRKNIRVKPGGNIFESYNRIYPISNSAGGMHYCYSCWSHNDQKMVDFEGTSFLYSRV